MDLQTAWKNLDREELSKPMEGEIKIHRVSKHPVRKLIWSFRSTLGFIVLFEAMFMGIFFTVTQPVVKILIGLIFVIYLFGFWANFRMLRNIETNFVLDANFKDSLNVIYKSTQTSLAFQRRVAIFVYPLACTTGFLWGLSIEHDAVEMIQQGRFSIALIITLIILTPTCYYIALWMEKISYGKYLIQLETLITELNQAE